MELSGYTTVARQSGLIREMRVVANNIANIGTAGYRQEGVVFSEYLQDVGRGDSLSMAAARIGRTSLAQGALVYTNAPLDFAIEGEAFFAVQTDAGQRLTRAGGFAADAAGQLVTAQGQLVLDSGGAPILLPPDGSAISVAPDGTMTAGDNIVAQLGLFQPVNPLQLTREGGVLFDPGADGMEPAFTSSIVQGAVEASNVNPVLQMARMIEVQRAYELGQSFLDAEDQRQRNATNTFVK